MDRKAAVIIILLVLLTLVIGHQWRSSKQLEEAEREQNANSKSKQEPISANLVEASKSPEAQVDMYQGVEVYLDAINWERRVFNSGNDNGIVAIGGTNDFKLNKIIFNPDPRNVGLPELLITAGAPQPLELNKFINETFKYSFSPALTKALSKTGPYETKEWDILDEKGKAKTRVKMDIWLMEFTVTIDARPSRDTTLSPKLAKMVSPITGVKNSNLGAEYKNQRYGNLDIVLKLDPTKSKNLDLPNQPHFGISALEVAYLDVKNDKEQKRRDIGVYLETGESLALYDAPTLTQGEAKYADYSNKNQSKMIEAAKNTVDTKQSIAWSNSIFDKERFAYIHLSSFGSWREGRWYQSKLEWADKIDVKFIIHVFVVGEWELKRPVVVGGLQSSTRRDRIVPGPFDWLSPANWPFGKYFSGSLFLIVAILLLALFFPPIFTILNTLFSLIARLLQSMLGRR